MSPTITPNDRPSHFHIIDDYARDRVTYHAACAARTAHLREVEREDLEQDLLLALCKAAPNFDPALASSHTFVSHVVRNASLHELRTRRRMQRCTARAAVLLSDLENSVAHAIRCPQSFDAARHDLRTDLASALRGVPQRTRTVARLLMHSTQAEAARALGISRQAIHAHVASLRASAVGALRDASS